MKAPVCASCDRRARLTSGREIYPHRKDLADHPIWRCDGCGRGVGPLQEFPGYMVLSDGSIWSRWNSRWGMTAKWHMRKLRLDREGYPNLTLVKDGKKISRAAHRLVLEAFIGPRPKDLEGCHGDGDSENNDLGNLRWDTSTANKFDCANHGTLSRGEKQPAAKLTDEKVKEMRALKASGVKICDLAAKYKMHKRNIYRALAGDTWGHIA